MTFSDATMVLTIEIVVYAVDGGKGLFARFHHVSPGLAPKTSWFDQREALLHARREIDRVIMDGPSKCPMYGKERADV